MKANRLVFMLLGLALWGCGGAAPNAKRDLLDNSASMGEKGKDAEQGAAKQPRAVERKIIYTAHVNIVVEEFDKGEEELAALVKNRGGYIAKSDMRGQRGMRRAGAWTVRIPVGQFDSFLESLANLGELTEKKLDSEDVTDQYYDTAAEVKNLESREAALRKLYEQKIGGSKLEDLLAVDREISNVRGNINGRKGQLQRWDKLSTFATVTVTLQGRKDYVPPLKPDFSNNVSRVFHESIEALVETGKSIALFAVMIAPWLPVIIVLSAPLYYLLHRAKRSLGKIRVRPQD
jgi:hypothetical protein